MLLHVLIAAAVAGLSDFDPTTTDPDGRPVVFDGGSRQDLALGDPDRARTRTPTRGGDNDECDRRRNRIRYHDYDARADVLYLSAEGHAGPPADAYASPEGHGIESDEARRGDLTEARTAPS